MSHPFELDPVSLEAMELDFEEQLTEEETARVRGGRHPEPYIVCISAPCPGSEGGGGYPNYPWPKPYPYPKPPVYTKALWETGGYPVVTEAHWEEGGYSLDY